MNRVLTRLADEQLRRISAKATEKIARRWWSTLGVWVACGFPKSGTTWLAQMLAGYLQLPNPQRYRLPIAMPSVLQAHWLPGKRTPRTLYIVRDGRDVMVSLYFYEVRLANSTMNPAAARRRRERLRRLFGPAFDPRDVTGNLPLFIEAEMLDPAWMTVSWPAHVQAWLGADPARVSIVRYEDLRLDPVTTLAPAIERLTQDKVDREALLQITQWFAYERQASDSRREHQQGPVLRSGQVQGWREYFNAAAERAFSEAGAGVAMRLGYLSRDDS